MERTEEQIVTQSSIVVVLGGKEYEVKPLVIKDAKNWRQKVWQIITSLPSEGLDVTSDTPEAFNSLMHVLLVTMQDTVLDLFFEYAKDLNRKEIEDIATEEDIPAPVRPDFPRRRDVPSRPGQLWDTESGPGCHKDSHSRPGHHPHTMCG